jgi:hypothetical protein
MKKWCFTQGAGGEHAISLHPGVQLMVLMIGEIRDSSITIAFLGSCNYVLDLDSVRFATCW